MNSLRKPGCRLLPSNHGAYLYGSEIIPDGDAGIARTVQIMQGLAHGRWGAKSIAVRKAALAAVRGTERGMDEITAVLDWIKRNIEFRGENGETLQSPESTLELGAGDCDCQSTLAAAMLQWLGYQTRFSTVAMIDAPEDLSHVYVEVKDKRSGQWLPLDSTVARSWPGWTPDGVARTVSSAPTMPNTPGGLGGLLFAGAVAALLTHLLS